VREQNRHRRAAAEDRGDVHLAFRPEADAGEVHSFAANRQPRTRILQYLNAAARQRRGQIMVIVVIAEDSEHAIRRR
jgi:hypothetical protein